MNNLAILISFTLSFSALSSNNDLLNVIPSETILKSMNITSNESTLISNITSNKLNKPDSNKVLQAIASIRTGNYQERKTAREFLMTHVLHIEKQLKTMSQDDDPEISETANNLLKLYTHRKRQLNNQEKTKAIVKILSVRSLANRQSKNALPYLEQLKSSPDQSLAYEVKRAISIIEKKALTLPSIKNNIDDSLSLIPENTSYISSFDFSSPESSSLHNCLTSFLNKQKNNTEAMKKLLKDLPETINKLGSIRIDFITFALSDTATKKQEKWSTTLVIKGQYDTERLYRDICRKRPSQMNFKEFKIEGVQGKLLENSHDMVIWLKDDNTMVILVEAYKKIVRIAEQYLATIKAEKTALKEWSTKLNNLHYNHCHVTLGKLPNDKKNIFTKEIKRGYYYQKRSENPTRLLFLTLFSNSINSSINEESLVTP